MEGIEINNKRYRIVYEEKNQLHNRNIPIIIKDFNILEDTYTNKKTVNFKIRNIGKKTIKFIKVCIQFFNNIDDLVAEEEYSIGNLDLKTNFEYSFKCNITSNNVNNKDVPKLKVQEIKFENKNNIKEEYIFENLKGEELLSNFGVLEGQYRREIMKLQSTINVKAKYHDFNEYWHCVCGNYYFNDVHNCPNCKIEKSKLEEITNKEFLEKELKEYKKKKEEIKNKNIKKAKTIGKNTLRIIVIIIIIMIIGIIIFFFGRDFMIKNMIKDNDFDSASKLSYNLYNNYSKYIYKLVDKYEKENKILEEYNILKSTINYISKYKEEKGVIVIDEKLESKYENIIYKYFLKLYENKNYNDAFLLIEEIELIEKYKNDENFFKISDDIKYEVSIKLMENKEYEKAIEILESIRESYNERDEKIKECKYQRGIYFFEKKKYQSAKKYFEEILDYKDSKDKYYKELIYNIANECLLQSNYQEAKLYFEEILDYKDSNEKYKETLYNLAKSKFEKYKKTKKPYKPNLELRLSEFQKADGFADSNNYIVEINEALKWEGDWYTITYSSAFDKYKFNVTIDWFNKEIEYFDKIYYFVKTSDNRIDIYTTLYNGEYSGHYWYAVLNNDTLTVYETDEYSKGRENKGNILKR